MLMGLKGEYTHILLIGLKGKYTRIHHADRVEKYFIWKINVWYLLCLSFVSFCWPWSCLFFCLPLWFLQIPFTINLKIVQVPLLLQIWCYSVHLEQQSYQIMVLEESSGMNRIRQTEEWMCSPYHTLQNLVAWNTTNTLIIQVKIYYKFRLHVQNNDKMVTYI